MKKLTRFIQVLLLVVGGITVLVIGWWLWQMLQEEEETEAAVRVPPQRPADVNIPLPVQPIDEVDEPDPVDEVVEIAEQVAAENAVPATKPDNLMSIDGIGPKYAQALAELGILTFSQLSAQDPAPLADQMQASGVRVTTDRIQQQAWIAQAARLAGLE